MKTFILSLAVLAGFATTVLPASAETCRTTCSQFGNTVTCRTSCY